jgi:hypothetical protein
MKDILLHRWIIWNTNEKGMEAAQVILILAIVTGMIVLVFPPILEAIQRQGLNAVNDIRNL